MKTKIRKSTGVARLSVAPPRRTASIRESITPARFELAPSLLQIKSILVPIDFSAQSEKALAYGVPFAKQFGARLTLLHVVEPIATPDFAGSLPLMMENNRVRAERTGHLERIVKDLEIEPKLVEKTLVRQGRSFHEIADAARTLKVDLIIISTHGHTGLKHAQPCDSRRFSNLCFHNSA